MLLEIRKFVNCGSPLPVYPCCQASSTEAVGRGMLPPFQASNHLSVVNKRRLLSIVVAIDTMRRRKNIVIVYQPSPVQQAQFNRRPISGGKGMQCVMCRRGETEPGTTTMTF